MGTKQNGNRIVTDLNGVTEPHKQLLYLDNVVHIRGQLWVGRVQSSIHTVCGDSILGRIKTTERW
jgi:hypothetical protein